jgi:hypothetical protein
MLSELTMKQIIFALLLGASVNAYASSDNFENSMYLRLGLGSRLYPAGDINKQFDNSALGGVKPQAPDQWAFNGDFSLGYQSPALFGIELGFTGGMGFLGGGLTSSYYSTRSSTTDIKATGLRNTNGNTFNEALTISSFYVMPALRLPMPGAGGRNYFHTIGFQLGSSTLTGWHDYYYTSSYSSYNYLDYDTFRAQSLSYGLNYRLEQMLGRRFSMGLDVGYTWVRFNPIYTYGGPVQADDGSAVSLDMSGPSIKLSLGLWVMRPFINPEEEAAAKAAKERRAEARRNRRNRGVARYDQYDLVAAQRLLALADAQMGRKNYEVAVELYQKTIDSDPVSRWAWQGLGNANYYLGKKEAALRAYEQAIALSNNDPRLQAMIDRVNRELAAQPLLP